MILAIFCAWKHWIAKIEVRDNYVVKMGPEAIVNKKNGHFVWIDTSIMNTVLAPLIAALK